MSRDTDSVQKKAKKARDVVEETVETEVDEEALKAKRKEEKRKRKEEKKKRKEQEAQNETEDAAMTDARESNKKDRKRKRDADASAVDGETVNGAVLDKRPQEEGDNTSPRKKHKKKKDKSSAPSESATEQTPITTSSSPNDFAPQAPPSTPAASAAFLTTHNITIHVPDGTPPVHPITAFAQLAIPASLRPAFAKFTDPTPIQACTWPPGLRGSDVVGIAETGSGKTLAFGIPALTHLARGSLGGAPTEKTAYKKSKKSSAAAAVLVVAPTRELALQTHDALDALGASLGIASIAVYGGVSKDAQVAALSSGRSKDGRAARIVCGTPGRILDLANDGACDLSGVRYLVLDEADRMLDKGFENDIRNIISKCAPGAERQTMMFSATWPEAVRRLASTFQRNPVRVTVGSDDLTANSRVEQSLQVFDNEREKDARLLTTLKSLSHKKTLTKDSSDSRVLVFALYKKEAPRVESCLRRAGYTVGALHGDMSQSARQDALDKFKTGETGLLVATDVAARGLDIPNVGAVINYTFPLTLEDYIHRIGRTGRGGRTGKSITFFTGASHERALAGELARVLRDGGFDDAADLLADKFPMTIKKKTHGAYGAFFRDDVKGTATKIVFD
ncbi:DEAD-domain-containing protein [Coniophora puteana RWD-64-598 SS2]|uniref:RNA helicase n=1 Tax=Coniophora puteana (strain RWD-64-598) TaxID=741705 RepID=A0A5M3N4M7_CONPW|nr:DEAD-domain-containing protein [Coniophora puteana RWD-64-598 SS2]EIW86256.1 DEAD-domain-containing protein [Coniophora puteana RWD-64-598 SS2]